ncbi:Conserved_hypothetical protein [Hexamita inflata]|uniref:Uncharacterized protein n=1 Tax=Hexamita inflata TaxID=28002 RepID=A0AA86UIX3_9EUKA|nr:Conserved hypothetical protein [Hexamita inflata]
MGASASMTSQDKEILTKLTPYDQKMIKKYKRQCKYKALEIQNDQEIVDTNFADYLVDLNVVHFKQCKNISFEKTPTTIRYFNVTSCDIEQFDGVSKMQQLIYLNLSQNRIKDISIISSLPGLISLILSNNQISDISPVARLVNLIEIKLDNNLIEDISVLKPLIKLERIWLFNNKVTNMEPIAQQMANAAGKNHHHHNHHHQQDFRLQPQNM